MVVNMMKWVPWPPVSSSKFQTKIIIHHVQDLSKGGQDGSSLSVEIKWKGSSNRISFKRGSVKRDMTKGGLVDHVCDLLGVGVNDGGFCQWDVRFKVFNGLKQGPKGSGNVVATGWLNLAEFAYAVQEKTPISIPLSVPCGIESSPILSISLCLLELRTFVIMKFYRKRFPDKHFDLETVLEAKTRSLEVVPEKSFVGFFKLEDCVFEFLDGAMSFDNIWDEISQNGSNSNHVYIVSWNDHFFILKVERDAY